MARFHTFTDIDLLPPQPSDLRYGPVIGKETSQYRVSGLFTGGSGTPKAYSVTRGEVFVQRSTENGLCNLILKPIVQPTISFAPVKYFVYRGLKLSSFLINSPDTELIRRSDAQSDLLKEIYSDWKEKNIGASISSNVLRLNLNSTNFSDAKLIDEVFETFDVDFQLPLVEAGWVLGDFDNSKNFGLDIILHGHGFYPTMKDARSYDNIISVDDSSNPPEPIDVLFQRENILNYVDPAAYYSLFFDQKIIKHRSDGTTERIKKEEIYDEVITKFQTKNSVYIDIRNEHSHSLNYYDNYKKDGDVFAKIWFAPGSSQLTEQEYHTSRWPILIKEFTADNTTDDLEITLRFPIQDNLTPFLFVQQSSFKINKRKKFIFRILDEDFSVLNFSEAITIISPNRKQNQNFSFIHQLHYGRRINANELSEAIENNEVEQIAKVIQPLHHFDLIFSPFSIKASWKIDSGTQIPLTPVNGLFPIRWINSHRENLYSWNANRATLITIIEGIANDGIGEVVFAHISRAEVFKEGSKEKHFATNSDSFKSIHFDCPLVMSEFNTFHETFFNNQEKLLNTGVFDLTNADQFFIGNYKTVPFKFVSQKAIVEINNVSTEVTLVNSVSSLEDYTDFKQDNLISFSYTYAEKEAISALIASSLQNKFPVYYVVKNYIQRRTLNSAPGDVFTSFELSLKGLGNSGNIEVIPTNIKFYSVNAAHFLTLDYINQIASI